MKNIPLLHEKNHATKVRIRIWSLKRKSIQ